MQSLIKNINKIFFLAFTVLILQNCAMTEDPEKSGGEIIAIPEGPWCEFNVSQDGKWVQYLGDTSPYFKNDGPALATHQRRALFVNLETGENHTPEPDDEVKAMIQEGLGPDAIGCFSPDQKTVYYSHTALSRGEPKKTRQIDTAQTDSRTRLSVPARPLDRYFYAVDLTKKPFTIVKTSHKQCAERSEPARPEIRVEQIYDKEIRFLSHNGRLLATHHPRGLLSSRITVFDPTGDHWKHSFKPAPGGERIAYFVSERGMLGFSAPTPGYWLDISGGNQGEENFLGASVYSFQWSDEKTLYACTSHSEHRRVIARWKL